LIEFEKISEETLESLSEALDKLLEEYYINDFDVNLAVSTIEFTK